MWHFNYDREVDVLNLASPPVSSKVYQTSLFRNNCHYLQAERICPRPFFEMSNFQVRQLGQLGTRGEYTAHFQVKRLDESGNIIDEQVEIVHASHSKHVREHTDWIKSRILTGVNDGLDLGSRKDELFSSLEFCEAVAKQLQGIRAGNIELQPVVKALFELENYSKTWKTGSFSLAGYPIEVSRESQPTLNKYRKQRTFRCPDGKERLFDWHVKLRLCNWRIHFFPDVGPGKIIIGYVGLHLPTVSDPT